MADRPSWKGKAVRPPANPRLYADRTDRLRRLIELNAPAGIVAIECWLVIKAYGGGRGYGWLWREWVFSVRCRLAYEVMAARHRIGWHKADCAACENDRLDVVERELVRADSGSLQYSEPYPEMDLRGLGDFTFIERGLSDTLGARLTKYEHEQGRGRSREYDR